MVTSEQVGELTHRLQAAEHRASRVLHATDTAAANDASERLAALVPVVQRNQLSKGSTQPCNTSLRHRRVTHPEIVRRNEAMRVFSDLLAEINATNQDLCTALAETTGGRSHLSVRNCLQRDGLETCFDMLPLLTAQPLKRATFAEQLKELLTAPGCNTTKVVSAAHRNRSQCSPGGHPIESAGLDVSWLQDLDFLTIKEVWNLKCRR